MTKLNQIIAVVNGKKTRVKEELTQAYHVIQKPDLFVGLSRKYTPLDEEGETIPPESKRPQKNVKDVVEQVADSLTTLLDITYTQDVGNTIAKADIKVDEQVLARDVPVTYLLFLEKQLVDIQTFISKLPVLDPAEQWSFDENVGCYVTEPFGTNRTKKVLRNHVKAEATDRHPAQVDTYTEDVKIGEYTTVKLSGALPAQKKAEMLERVRRLIDAVKVAREEANSLEISSVSIAKKLFEYIT